MSKNKLDTPQNVIGRKAAIERKGRMNFKEGLVGAKWNTEFERLYTEVQEYHTFVMATAKEFEKISNDKDQTFSKQINGFPPKNDLTLNHLYAKLETTSAVADEMIHSFGDNSAKQFAKQNVSFLRKIVNSFMSLIKKLTVKMGFKDSAAEKQKIIAGLKEMQESISMSPKNKL